MLEPTTSNSIPTTSETNGDIEKVTCFVCKKEVAREQTKKVHHPKQKDVWVCGSHIK